MLYQLYYSGSTLKVFRVTDLNDGSPFIVDDLTVGTPGGSVANVFPVLSIDKVGNLYVVWSSSAQAIFMATSTDRGQTWSVPKRVSPTTLTGTNIMPWVVAGDPGRVDVVWYRTPGANGAGAVWDIHMAQTLDALSASPTFTLNKVNETPIHNGEICLRGLNCDLPTSPGDRSFLEFPSIDIDSRGAAYITYNDNTNQVQGAYVVVARQTTGASLFNSIGSVDEPDSGQVTIAAPTAGQILAGSSFTSSGTHSLPYANADNDERGDAKFPDHGAVIGANIPAMDIQQVSVTDDPNFVTVKMQLGDLTLPALAAAPAQSGGDGVLYLTQWEFNGKVYWVAAEVRASQPVFLTGTLGIIKSATSKKYITFNPDPALSLQVQGQITNGAPGTITLKIPRSIVGSPANGSGLFSVTGYSLSERGALLPVGSDQVPNPTSLPIQVDAAGPFTYVMGNGATFDGVVEVSVDNATFANARLATLNTANNAWQFVLSGADMAPGTHTLYVREKVNGHAPSAAASVSYVQGNEPPPCIEDNDPRIAYSGGWHLINNANASDGHFRYHTGNSSQHFAKLDFNVPAGNNGSITYSFAKSPKGGAADIYLDGVFRQRINYSGSIGTTQQPEFRPEYNVSFSNLPTGAHTLEIRNMSGVVYLDRICLQNSNSTAQPSTGPGNTSNQSGNAAAGQTSSSSYQPQSGSQEISVSAESNLAVPFKVILVDPSGVTLQTADAVSGIATISQPVTQGGIYVIKVVNLSLGPLQFTVTTTPTVRR
jgi:hypothetical protein